MRYDLYLDCLLAINANVDLNAFLPHRSRVEKSFNRLSTRTDLGTSYQSS